MHATNALVLALAVALLPAPGVPAAAAAPEEPPAPAPAPAPKPAPEDDRALLEKLVEQAKPVVEKARGLKFTRPVPVAPVTAEQFVEKFLRDFHRVLGGEERVAPASRLLARLGILPEGSDLRALLGKFLEGNVAANYDPETGRVSFLPGARRSLSTMVHELVHALDDQAFDMKAQIALWGGNLDRALAYGALAEGDAQSVEVRFATGGASASQPLEQLRVLADAMANAVLQQKFGPTPPALVLAFKSQYTEGACFAEALRRTEKGEEAVNGAFRNPPSSTEQILHPDKYLAAEAPVVLELPPPPPGAKVAIATTLGELGSRIVLLARGLDPASATGAAAGWAGDTAALVAFPEGEALLWTSAWDTETEAAQFYEALKRAFPDLTGEASLKSNRFLVQRGTTVEFVEAPLEVVADALGMLKGARRK